MSEGDGQLISRALAGEGSAYEGLYEAHARRIMAYLLRSGFARADADDLLQETFLRAFRSLGTFDDARGSFRTWVSAIARNVARKHWQRRSEAEDFDPELAEDVLVAADNPTETAAAREEMDAVGECVAALPEELRRIVRLRYVEGRTTRGVAAAAGIPEATVRLRLKEAHARLQQCLKARGVMA